MFHKSLVDLFQIKLNAFPKSLFERLIDKSAGEYIYNIYIKAHIYIYIYIYIYKLPLITLIEQPNDTNVDKELLELDLYLEYKS